MVHRQEAEGLVLISQPAHAWLSGQLALNWGNELFGDFVPRQHVYQAAALHDIGFLNWEQTPTLNTATGLPHCFRDLPADIHFRLWSRSVEKMMRYGRYSALMVSLHFVHLSRKHRKLASPKEFELKKQFIAAQEALQTTLVTSLRNDFYFAPFATPEILERNQRLLSVWDWMSLACCIGFTGKTELPDAPTAQGLSELALIKKDSNRIAVHPWPFRENGPIQLVCEGRHLLTKFTDEIKMREAIRGASPVTLKVELVKEN